MGYLHAGLTEMRKAAIHRREDAKTLRDGRRWRGAMYMMGYSVECSIKARLMERFTSPNLEELEAELSRRLRTRVDLRTHSLSVLMGVHVCGASSVAWGAAGIQRLLRVECELAIRSEPWPGRGLRRVSGELRRSAAVCGAKCLMAGV